MAIDVIHGSSDKPVASSRLVDVLLGEQSLKGCLFVGYPIIGTAEGQHRVDALLVSPDLGIVVFDLVEGTNPGSFCDRQDNSANQLDARLRVHRKLVERRELRIAIHTVSFAPAGPDIDDGAYCGQNDNLIEMIAALKWPQASEEIYRWALSVIESVSSIQRGKVRRKAVKPKSRGTKLAQLEKSIATLDRDQNRAVIETVEGVQRIRGLAGSGKTIVLALKAAYLHALNPNWRIAVSFHTRSLKDIFRQYIEGFHLERASELPDWDKVRVVNAWGSPSDDQPGLYFEFCKKVGTRFLSFREARRLYGPSREFVGACRAALDKGREAPFYDAILVDEAQDFPPEFLQLCHAFLRKPRRLVYAYDELQNLERESLPSPEQIFGTDKDGRPLVSIDSGQDIVLSKCYRNPGPVLAVAHALGFGIYRVPPKGKSTGLVQMFDDARLWEEVGYQVIDGSLRPDEHVTLSRSPESSPDFLSKHSEPADLVCFQTFDSEQEQDKWIANQIARNLDEDELRPPDVLIIHSEPYTTQSRTAELRAQLLNIGKKPYLAGLEGHRDVFWPDNDSIVISSVHRAKGNEAAMVYVMDSHECQSDSMNLARRRNRLFTAITRSKAWVRVLGVGPKMRELEAEYKKVLNKEFRLQFRYPTEKERENMRIAHRDRSAAETKRVETDNRALSRITDNLSTGDTSLSDLDPNIVEKLRNLLKEAS